jgi:hypothetical protein
VAPGWVARLVDDSNAFRVLRSVLRGLRGSGAARAILVQLNGSRDFDGSGAEVFGSLLIETPAENTNRFRWERVRVIETSRAWRSSAGGEMAVARSVHRGS